MSKFIIVFLILTSFQFVNAQSDKVATYRKMLENATTEESLAKRAYKQILEDPSQSPLILGFKSSICGIMCLYTKNPNKLLKYVNESSTFANEAIEKDPDNLELHFIRYSLEYNTPKILGKSKHLNSDKKFLESNFDKAHIKNIPYNSLEIMIHFLEKTNQFSNQQIVNMRALIQNHH